MKTMEPTKTSGVVADFEQVPVELDHIKCPKYGNVQSAKIILTHPKKKYLLRCTTCDFVINKENWNSIQ